MSELAFILVYSLGYAITPVNSDTTRTYNEQCVPVCKTTLCIAIDNFFIAVFRFALTSNIGIGNLTNTFFRNLDHNRLSLINRAPYNPYKVFKEIYYSANTYPKYS